MPTIPGFLPSACLAGTPPPRASCSPALACRWSACRPRKQPLLTCKHPPAYQAPYLLLEMPMRLAAPFSYRPRAPRTSPAAAVPGAGRGGAGQAGAGQGSEAALAQESSSCKRGSRCRRYDSSSSTCPGRHAAASNGSRICRSDQNRYRQVRSQPTCGEHPLMEFSP